MRLNAPRFRDEYDGVRVPALGRMLRELVNSLDKAFGALRLEDRLSIGGGEYIVKHLSKTATLNFAAPGGVPGSVDLTIAAPGAAFGDTVTVAAPLAVGADYVLTGFVSAADTVTVRWTQVAGAAADPDGAGGTYRVDIWKH